MAPTPEVIMLSEAQLALAARVADVRNDKKGVPNYRESRKHPDWQMHFHGAQAELAVCRRFAFPLARYGDLDGDNGLPDLYIGELRAEVKAPFYDPPIVKFNSLIDLRADVLIVCSMLQGRRLVGLVRLHGYIRREHFIAQHTVRDFNQGVRACIDVAHLAPLHELDAHVPGLHQYGTRPAWPSDITSAQRQPWRQIALWDEKKPEQKKVG
jgi:hypothetical protein